MYTRLGLGLGLRLGLGLGVRYNSVSVIACSVHMCKVYLVLTLPLFLLCPLVAGISGC